MTNLIDEQRLIDGNKTRVRVFNPRYSSSIDIAAVPISRDEYEKLRHRGGTVEPSANESTKLSRWRKMRYPNLPDPQTLDVYGRVSSFDVEGATGGIMAGATAFEIKGPSTVRFSDIRSLSRNVTDAPHPVQLLIPFGLGSSKISLSGAAEVRINGDALKQNHQELLPSYLEKMAALFSLLSLGGLGLLVKWYLARRRSESGRLK